MLKLLILGIGSSLGQDQIAEPVINLLQQTKQLNEYCPQYLQMIYYDRPGMHLIERIQGAETVFIIDAMRSYSPVGSLHIFTDLGQLKTMTHASSHSMGVTEAIDMAGALNVLPEKLVFYGIEIDVENLSSEWPDSMFSSIDKLAARVQKDALEVLNLNYFE